LGSWEVADEDRVLERMWNVETASFTSV
jgi:hypothetical protein